LKEVRKHFFLKKEAKTFINLDHRPSNSPSSPPGYSNGAMHRWNLGPPPDLIGRSTPAQTSNQTVPWFDHQAPVPSSRPAAGMPPRAGAVKDLPRQRRAQRVLDGAEHGGRLGTGGRQL
jgi:hypothetical protein